MPIKIGTCDSGNFFFKYFCEPESLQLHIQKIDALALWLIFQIDKKKIFSIQTHYEIAVLLILGTIVGCTTGAVGALFQLIIKLF